MRTDRSLPSSVPQSMVPAGAGEATSPTGTPALRTVPAHDPARQRLLTALSSPRRIRADQPAVTAVTLDHVVDATLGSRAARLDRMISTDIEIAGSGHVVWGSKPMLWAHDACYALLGELACKIDLKPNFAWVGPHETDPANTGGDRGRFIVNKFNLGKLLARHPAYFSRIVEPLAPTVDNLIAELQQRAASGIDNIDHCLLGVLLGYGMDNAQQFNAARQREAGRASDYLVGPQDRPVSTGDFLERIIPIQQGLPRLPLIGAIPAFVMWKSDESTALIQQYVNESLDIHAIFLRDAWTAPRPARAVSRAFLAELFDVPAASYLTGPMHSR